MVANRLWWFVAAILFLAVIVLAILGASSAPAYPEEELTRPAF